MNKQVKRSTNLNDEFFFTFFLKFYLRSIVSDDTELFPSHFGTHSRLYQQLDKNFSAMSLGTHIYQQTTFGFSKPTHRILCNCTLLIRIAKLLFT